MSPAATRAFSALFATLFALVVAAGAAAGEAAAEPPLRLPAQVVDPANAVDDAQHARLEKAIADLDSSRQIQMWVVFVRNFDGRTAREWTDETMDRSELGVRDVVLAVATDERAYRLSATTEIEGLTVGEIDKVVQEDLVPELKAGRWADAAVAAARGLDSAGGEESTGNGGAVLAGIAGVAVVGGAGAYLYTRRRRRRDIEKTVDGLRDDADSLTADQLAQQPLEVLEPWSREILTDTDNAIKTSADELALAVDEFGAADAAPFTAALDNARAALATSFTLRQRLDDDVAETPDERRALLVQIIKTCSDADAELDRQVEAFDQMRDLLINADARLDELTRRIVEVTARIPVSEALLAKLTEKHGAAVASIAANVDLAREQVQFAEDNTDQGREGAAAPAGSQGPVVGAIRSAEGALDAADRLLDAVDGADAALARARTGLSTLISEVRAELDEARSLDTSAELEAAVTQARAAVDRAEAGGDTDPLGTFTALTDADTALDAALTTARTTTAERSRIADLLANTTSATEAKIAAANDFIETRRGVVGATARTRLAEAVRHAKEAAGRGPTDAADALTQMRNAGSLADEALAAAQADVAAWTDSQRPQPSPGGGFGGLGPVVTGILVDSVLRGGVRGGSFTGGYSHDGRSPGSFGGSSSSGRIGVGGRF